MMLVTGCQTVGSQTATRHPAADTLQRYSMQLPHPCNAGLRGYNGGRPEFPDGETRRAKGEGSISLHTAVEGQLRSWWSHT
jgi:hypothetical protein